MWLLGALALLLVGCGAASRPPGRAGSPVPEVSDPAPPSEHLLGILGGKIVDNDADGAYLDGCADTREDHDGHRDDDGCADPDNDGDGLLDVRDACPDRAEDGIGDAYDGCPHAAALVVGSDLDGDGVIAGDVCMSAAEDLDGFEDEDGCPDPDDDGDGILDALDRCPRRAEDGDTRAGGDRSDGCPR